MLSIYTTRNLNSARQPHFPKDFMLSMSISTIKKRCTTSFLKYLVAGYIVCAAATSLKALSLHDLEKRPSLKIAGIKILHNGKKIIVGIGDMTEIEKVDALVIPVHEDILGVIISGSISKVLGVDGGCKTYREINNNYQRSLGIGSALLTSVPQNTPLGRNGYQYMVHAIVTDGRVFEPKNNWPQLISNVYQNTLEVIKEKNIHSIIIPFLDPGIGVFGCPENEALQIMMETIVDSLKHDPELKTLQEVILVVWSGTSDAQTKAQEWLSALNTALYGQDKNYTTLVGTSFNPNTKENILT